jgi:PilZ domain
MTTARGIERRKAPRRLTRQLAWIVDPDSRSNLREGFRLFDISVTGARICVQRHVELPDEFLLFLVPGGHVARRCRIVWRDAAYVGVEFIEHRGKPVPTRLDTEIAVNSTTPESINLDCLAITAASQRATFAARV